MNKQKTPSVIPQFNVGDIVTLQVNFPLVGTNLAKHAKRVDDAGYVHEAFESGVVYVRWFSDNTICPYSAFDIKRLS